MPAASFPVSGLPLSLSLGRADHLWSAAVERGRSTLPQDNRMRCHRIPTRCIARYLRLNQIPDGRDLGPEIACLRPIICKICQLIVKTEHLGCKPFPLIYLHLTNETTQSLIPPRRRGIFTQFGASSTVAFRHHGIIHRPRHLWRQLLLRPSHLR